MQIEVPFTVVSSMSFASKKDGKRYVKVAGFVSGFGLFQFIVSENKVPDEIEGKKFVVLFKCYVDRDFNLKLGVDSFVEEIKNA